MKNFEKTKFKKFKKKTWWKDFIYSVYAKKKKPYQIKYKFVKILRTFRKKESFFNHFEFKSLVRRRKNLKIFSKKFYFLYKKKKFFNVKFKKMLIKPYFTSKKFKIFKKKKN